MFLWGKNGGKKKQVKLLTDCFCFQTNPKSSEIQKYTRRDMKSWNTFTTCIRLEWLEFDWGFFLGRTHPTGSRTLDNFNRDRLHILGWFDFWIFSISFNMRLASNVVQKGNPPHPIFIWGRGLKRSVGGPFKFHILTKKQLV